MLQPAQATPAASTPPFAARASAGDHRSAAEVSLAVHRATARASASGHRRAAEASAGHRLPRARASAATRPGAGQGAHRRRCRSAEASAGRRARAAHAAPGRRRPAARARKLASGVSPSAGAGNLQRLSHLASKPWWVQGDLDYMHARHCSPLTGRFLSVDPALESADPYTPQTWNRYNYTAGNPLKYIDPSGEVLVFTGTAANVTELQDVANDTLHGFDLVIDANGQASLVANNDAGSATAEQAAFATALQAAIDRPETVTIGIESGDPGIMIGQYITGTIDIRDIAATGQGTAVSSATLLAHEIAEQTARQVFNLGNTRADFDTAHRFGVAAQEYVGGFTLLSQNDLTNRGTGRIVSQHQRGTQTITTTFRWLRGNLIRVNRR